MAIDRGGLQYRIQVDGNFASQFATFRSELAAVRADWAAFRANVNSAGNALQAASAGVQELKEETRLLGVEAAEAAFAEEKLGDQEKLRERVVRDLNRELDKLSATQAKEELIAEKRILLGERSLIQQRGEVAALKQVNAAMQKEVTLRERAKIARELGISHLFESKKALTAEAIAAERSAKAQRELAVQRLLALQGLDQRGRPVADGPVQGAQTLQQSEQTRLDQAQRAFNKELESVRQKALIDQLKEANPEYQKLTENTRRVTRQTKDLAQEVGGLEGRVNRIGFTFRRLFGILAAFTVVREVFAGFANTIRTAVTASSELEQTSFGIAGLITSLTDIRNAQGEVVKGTDAFKAAQLETIKIMQRLRIIAQQTAGSYQEIIDTFQQALAPGLAAGLNIGQIEEVTKLVSQAASAIGLQQNQLNQEIRALLTGEGSAINTRLFQTGLFSPETITRAKELGGPDGLLELIRTRLKGIAIAGQAALGTLTVEASNAADAFRQLLSESGGNFLTSLKELVRGFRQTIQQSSTESITDPKALGAFQALFDGLADGVKSLLSSLRSLDLDALKTFLGTLGDTIGAVVAGIGTAINVVVRGLDPLLSGFRVLVGVVKATVRALDDFTSGAFSGFAKEAVAIGVSFLSFLGTALLLEKVFKGLVLAGAALKVSASIMLVRWTAIRSLIFDTAVGMANLAKAAGLVGKRLIVVTGVLAALLAVLDMTGQLSKVLDGLDNLLSPIIKKVESLFDSLLNRDGGAAANTALDTVQGVTQSVAAMAAVADEALQKLDERAREVARNVAAEMFTIGLSPAAATSAERVANALRQADEDTYQIQKQRNTLLGQQKSLTQEISSLQVAQQKAEQDALKATALLQSSNRGAEVERIQEALSLQDSLTKMQQMAASTGDTDAAMKEFSSAVARAKADFGSIEEALKNTERTLSSVGGTVQQELIVNRQQQIKLENQINEKVLTRLNIEDGIAAVEVQLNKIRVENLRLALLELSAINARRRIELDIERRQLQLSVSQVLRRSDAEAAGSQKRLELLSAVEEVENRVLELQLKREQVGRDEVGYARMLDQFRSNNITESELLLDLERAIVLEKEHGTLESQLAVANLRQAVIQLRQLKQEQGDDFLGGLGKGAKSFADQNSSLFQIGQQFGPDALGGLSSTLADQVGAAFDPNRNPDLGLAIGQLALRLGVQLVEQGISRVIAELIPQTAAPAADLAAALALQSAGDTLVLAAADLSVAAFFIDFSGGALDGAAINLDLASIGLDIAAGVWGPIAKMLLAAAVLLRSGGGGAGGAALGGPAESTLPGFAKGGPAGLGFALGGRTPRRHNFGRPKGLDPRDTIPAWLRPHEWVIRPEAVGYYGQQVMAAINSARIPAGTLKALAGVSGRTGAKMATSPGFASGGSANKAPLIETRPQQEFTQSIIVSDRQTVDQLLAGGRPTLHRYARRDRTEMRTALGI
jgi:hypothetical protein